MILGKINKSYGVLYGWWENKKGLDQGYNCFSPYFNNKKQAINWLVKEMEIKKVYGKSVFIK